MQDRQKVPSPGSGRATLKSIAELTGVHVSTVSRVLNGSRTNARGASQETAERIRQVAGELGYVPDALASAMRTQSSRLLGVVMARLGDQVLGTIYEGIERAAWQFGFHTMVGNSFDDPQIREEYVSMLRSRRVDAMIFGDADMSGDFLRSFERHNLPFVLVNRFAEGFPSVTCDDYAGGRMAAEHLFERGHRRVAVLAGTSYASNAVERTRGLTDFFAEAGAPVSPELVVMSTFDVAGGAAATERLLASPEPPTAIFAVSDFAAIGALGVLRDAGLTPGRDIAVVGFNDVPAAAAMTVPLSSVHSPMAEVGSAGVEMLMKVLAGDEVESVMIAPRLVIRESSAHYVQP